MNITTRLNSIKALWASAFPSIPYSLQLSGQNEAVPNAVLEIGQIEQFGGTTTKKGWRLNAEIKANFASDTDAISNLDTIVSTFNRAKSANWYYMVVTNASVTANYQGHGSLWQITVSLVVEWTT